MHGIIEIGYRYHCSKTAAQQQGGIMKRNCLKKLIGTTILTAALLAGSSMAALAEEEADAAQAVVTEAAQTEATDAVQIETADAAADVTAEEGTAPAESAEAGAESGQDGTELVELPESFLIYISGIDTFGDVSTQSRSDVNLLMAVNRNTGKILLVNTPRDYYVELPISEGQQDKLTHAGIYGVDVSKGAMEMLYDVPVDYYARLNFSSFETIIDALGGIEVYSEYDFVAQGFTFTQGMNTLNGEQALAFVRERKSFAEGDVQRGKDQMEMLKALITRLGTFDGLNAFAQVYDEVAPVVETNLTKDQLLAIAAEQILNGRSWDVETYYVTGADGSEVTYSIPGAAAYVMIPNEDEVAEGTQKLQAILAGN